ncbi:MAG: YggS family pyridoxal phosphate-dependent enzyme [Actinobacteria bacterium]|nr:YggS family pyridoxal phosphate-dependent enzyme [Actinomycetota bacterium]
MNEENTVYKRLQSVIKRLSSAAERSGRSADDITLVVVTKEASDSDLIEALKTGLVTDVGENRVQNLLNRLDFFNRFRVKVHFIGRLQTNKVKKIIGRTHLIQSLDRENLLKELSERAVKNGVTVDVLIEVNVSKENTKAGVSPETLFDFVEKTLNSQGVNLRGLMMMAPFLPPEECRPYFRKTFKLFDKLKNELKKPDFDILSMGMSNDFEVAIEEGSTMIRIGSAIFRR